MVLMSFGDGFVVVVNRVCFVVVLDFQNSTSDQRALPLSRREAHLLICLGLKH